MVNTWSVRGDWSPAKLFTHRLTTQEPLFLLLEGSPEIVVLQSHADVALEISITRSHGRGRRAAEVCLQVYSTNKMPQATMNSFLKTTF